MQGPQDMRKTTPELDTIIKMRVRHVATAFWLTIIFLVGGLAAIVYGIFSLTGGSSSGVPTTIIGAFSTFFGAVIFKFYNNENRLLREDRQEKSDREAFLQDLSQRERIIDKMPKGADKTRELKALAKAYTDGPPRTNRGARASPPGHDTSGFWKRIARDIFKL